MRLACRYALPLAMVLTVSLIAEAHPGHAHEVVPAHSGWHYWLQPEHAMVSGMLLALPFIFYAIVGRRWLAARRAQRMIPLPSPRRQARDSR